MISLSGYEIIDKIYDSINSKVYRAIREIDRANIIIKLLKEDYPTPNELTHYQQEYQLISLLDIEGVVKAYSLEKYHNTLLMILEDFGGESWQKLSKTQEFSLENILTIAIKISETLGQIHSHNIIHKDINPANIVINLETKQVKIIDFGISTQLTKENLILKNPNILEGTLSYISPEQTGRMNRSLDYRTDFYSLGVTLYEMFTKTLPFNTEDNLELVHCHIAKQPLLPSEINPLIPSIIDKIILKLMAKNAEDRYQTAWGLKADLENCLQQLQLTNNIENFTLGSQDISDQFEIPQKLYGRDSEIKILLSAFDRICDPLKKTRGELMLIAGYSGIGKTVLVREIYKPVTVKKGYFITGKFDQFQRNIPYSAIVQALKELIKHLLTETAEKLNHWRVKLLEKLGINAQVIINVIPELELIIGKQLPVSELGANEAQNRFNIVFQNFINVFTTTPYPLVLFLDDLQWADSASLKLIEVLMNGDAKGLFLIGAYRDNEVTSAYPLMLTVDDIAKNGAMVERVFLSPLDLVTVSQLIADALKTTPEKVKPLAQLVLLKTGGNPFFLNEFLRSLYTENLLRFDSHSLSWFWDIEEIQKRDFTDNVVELMMEKIKKLPLETQNILKIGAVIGNQFDLLLVSTFLSLNLRDIINNLDIAISQNLVIPLDTKENIALALLNIPNYQLPPYKFIHDRIQQSAYSLIPPEEKPAIHLKIGQILLENTVEIDRDKKIFAIVEHLNLSRELITEKNQRHQLAQLNLMAGQKAKKSIAHVASIEYLKIAIELLPKNSWETDYDFTLELYLEATEVSYLKGDFSDMEIFGDIVISHSHNLLDKIGVYETKLQA